LGEGAVARSKLLFRESDVARAIRAASKAGVQVARVVIEPGGNIVVVAAAGDNAPSVLDSQNPSLAASWDDM
jgi:hypothetical protein